MSDLLLDIVTVLVDNSIVLGDGIDTFRDCMPDAPDDIVAIYEYQGSPIANNEEAVHRSVQIKVRSLSATTAKNKAREIFNLLNVPTKQLKLTQERWCMLYPRQVPFKIEVDKKNRVIYGFNAGVTTYADS